MPCLYLFFNVLVYGILVVFIFPFWKPAEIALCAGIEVIAMVFWLRAIRSNPGYIEKPKDL
jgi:hypothetical protein